MFLTSCVETVIVSSVAAGGVATREKSLSDTPKDIVISTKIGTAFFENGLKNPFNSVDVTVNEGRVLLTGIVEDDDRAQLANDLSWKVKGVKEVIDEIQLHSGNRNATSRIAVASYDYITSIKIEGKLLISSNVRSFNYQITTVNKNVYVLGTARNRTELNKVLEIVSKTTGVEKVINHAILADDSRRTGKKAARDTTYKEEDEEEVKTE